MKDLMERLRKFKDDRDWQQYHEPRELARSLMIEGAELNRLYQWGKTPNDEQLKDEVADCLIYGLNLCLQVGFDPIQICNEKITKNGIKYPVPE